MPCKLAPKNSAKDFPAFFAPGRNERKLLTIAQALTIGLMPSGDRNWPKDSSFSSKKRMERSKGAEKAGACSNLKWFVKRKRLLFSISKRFSSIGSSA
jgi:hypothetical protein